MISPYKNVKEYIGDFFKAFSSPEIKTLFSLVLLIIIIGTVFYRIVENWSWLDSYYFSVMSLTTVGYGDLAPVTGLGKIFTSIYVLASLGIIFAFVKTLARQQTSDAFLSKIFKRKKE